MKVLILGHRVLSVVIMGAMLLGGYYTYGTLTSIDGETRYVTAVATKTTLISSITGTGQVSSSNQVDIKAQVSGEILALPVREGGDVRAGTAIAYLDATLAEKAVRDAATNLETAQLALQKLQQPPDQLQLTQSENSLARTITAKHNAEDGLKKAYDDGFNSVSNAFLDLPGVVSGLHDLLYTANAQLGGTSVQNIDYYTSTANLFDPRGSSFGADANTKYQIALTKYNQNFQDYKALNRTDDPTKIEVVIAETYDTALAVSEALKSANNLIQFFEDQVVQHNQKIPAVADAQLATLNTYTGKVNTRLTDLLSITSTIKNDKNTIVDANRSIDEGTQSLAKLKAGTDPLDLRSAGITVTQRENALLDAKTTLADYVVRTPFAGTLAKLNVQKGDTAGSGAVIGTLVAKQQIAQLSLNETDVAKVNVGAQATLTFDAIDGLTLTGIVSEIDTLGTVSQGVVNYTVKIVFDTQDDRVKSGMTVSAAIITNVKTDVLTVPNSAIKTTGGNSFVQIFTTPLPQTSGTQGTPSAISPLSRQVEIGIANDTVTEIVSGLNEGDVVVTRTITGTTAAPAPASATSLLGGNRGGGGGGNFRIGG